MNKIVVTASEIGKTAYCPHAHYLSTKHGPNKAAKKQLAQGNKMHNTLNNKSERMHTKSALNSLINTVLVIITIGLILTIYQYLTNK